MEKEIVQPATAVALSRTEKYEYACAVTKQYLEHEKIIGERAETARKVFDKDSFLFKFFVELDPRTVIMNQKSHDWFINLLTPPKDPNLDSFAGPTINRLYRLLWQLEMALGSSFIDDCIEDTAENIVRAARPTDIKWLSISRLILKTKTRNFLRKFPILILISFGYKEVMERTMTRPGVTTKSLGS